MTALVHGEAAARSAVAGAQVLFGGSVDAPSKSDLLAVLADIPKSHVDEAFGATRSVVDLHVDAGLVKSKGEARRLLDQGGVYVNNERRTRDNQEVNVSDLLFGEFLLLRAGKKKYHLLAFQPD